jgi:hypothetical protein
VGDDASLYITTSLWLAQKHCVRVLFGNEQAYLEKYMTCAKARQFNDQALGNALFQLEHRKPLFKEHDILAFKNLYSYHTLMEVFKILKLECPMALHQRFRKRKFYF